MPITSTVAPRLLPQPLTLPNGTVLRNRLAKAAMSETLGTYNNQPTPALVGLDQRLGHPAHTTPAREQLIVGTPIDSLEIHGEDDDIQSTVGYQVGRCSFRRPR
ncbi:hypothetical protein J2W49_002469 [Hydrogenophaga palleronii]|uniref:Uncharacterized protein n=1 Tax=Hydrogenophaga palleronii TaxID=65655 RepID=A0ABU1WNC8_9BURK|nr:hypothetical protein [Hydrogenophaga palleronii]MDR7150511.1 hypothetical protein [Hydrogenophaga palleronii]